MTPDSASGNRCWTLVAVLPFLRVAIALALTMIGSRLDAKDVIEDIATAWSRRIDHTPSITLEWTERQTRPKGTVVMFGPDKREILSDDLVITTTKSFVSSKGRFRLFEKGSQFDQRTGSIEQQPFEHTLAFSGFWKSFRNYTRRPFNSGTFAKTISEISDATNRPVMYALYPTGENRGRINLENYVLEPTSAEVAGRRCVVLTRRPPAPVDTQLYLDSERNWLILRVAGLDGETVTRQVDITYDSDEAGRLYPASWEFVILENGGMNFAFTLSATTTKVDFRDSARDSDFDIAFPVGTVIHDKRGDQVMTLFVDGDKRIRPLQPWELERSAEDILKMTSADSTRWWLFVGSACTFVLLTGAIVVRHFLYKRRKQIRLST